MPSWVRVAMAGVIVGLFASSFLLLDEFEHGNPDPDHVLEKIVRVPVLDDKLLSKALDTTSSERLLIEPEPLRHLLGKSIDVGPSVAAALQIPAEMVPVDQVVEHIDDWRHRWLWYEGKLTQLSGPRKGHPIDGYSIYEATLELDDGSSVITAFSVLPKETLKVGDWVRAEGYLLKLRDTTYPTKLEQVPMLVGRTLQRDYPDWPKITEIDHTLFEGFDDSSFWPGDLPMHTVEEDQGEILWHLGAYVRDTADEWTFADWRKVTALSSAEPYDRLINGEVAHGEPMRVFGTLIRRSTIAAPANPANIKFWTAVWVQVHGFGGHLVPIWIPKKVGDLPLRAQLEVRGFYYRWFIYNAAKGNRYRVPLFLASDLDLFELDTNKTMLEIGVWIGGMVTVLLALAFWTQRRNAQSALRHGRHMDERRRQRRERDARQGGQQPRAGSTTNLPPALPGSSGTGEPGGPAPDGLSPS